MRPRLFRFATRSAPGSRLIRFLWMIALAAALAAARAAGAGANAPGGGQLAVFTDPASGKMGVRDAATGAIVLPPEHDVVKPLVPSPEIDAAGPRLFVVGKKPASGDAQYGVMDPGRNYVVPAEYDEIGAIHDGVIAVRRQNKWGFVDNNGKILVSPEYEEVWSHGRNCGVVKVNGKYGAVDMSGNTIAEPIYDGIAAAYPSTGGKYCFDKLVVVLDGKRRFVDLAKAGSGDGRKPSGDSGRAVISRYKDGGKFGFKSSSGGTIVEPVFEDAWDFSNGYARVKKDGKWGFIDSTGKIVVEPAFNYLWDYDGSRAKVRLDDGSTKYIDMTGKFLD